MSAALWVALGGVILIASWRMDRLENLGINPWSAPGLTPGVVGALMILLALALVVQARRAGAVGGAVNGAVDGASVGADDGAAEASASAGSARRTLIAAALCVLFGGVMLGHGVPFVVAGACFIFAFTAIFSWPTWREERRIGRGLVQAFVVAVIACTAIAWLFESVFLVRLP